MIINELKQVANKLGMRFGQGNSTSMDLFFEDGGGIFCLFPVGAAVAGIDTYVANIRGEGAAGAVKEIEDFYRNVASVKVLVSRRSDGYAVTLTQRMVVPVYGGGKRPSPPAPATGNYLYLESLTGTPVVTIMSLMTTAPDIEYSTDGVTFQTLPNTYSDGLYNFDTITLSAVGDKVYLRGVNAALSDSDNSLMTNINVSGGTAKAGGTVQSLVDGTGDSTTAIEMANLFGGRGMDDLNGITEVDAGLLSATTLVKGCYAYLFPYSLLEESPILPAVTLVDGCYENMFQDCSNLTKITCLATDISATNCTTNWVSNVAANGTFVKAAGMTDWTTGADGIPSGWTVQDA